MAAGASLWLEKYVLTAVSAGMLALSLVLMAVSGLVSRKKRRALCRRYGSSSQEDWQRQADHYIDALINQQQREDAYRERLEQIARPAGWKFTEIITTEDKDDLKRWRELAKEG